MGNPLKRLAAKIDEAADQRLHDFTARAARDAETDRLNREHAPQPQGE